GFWQPVRRTAAATIRIRADTIPNLRMVFVLPFKAPCGAFRCGTPALGPASRGPGKFSRSCPDRAACGDEEQPLCHGKNAARIALNCCKPLCLQVVISVVSQR